MTEVDKSLVLTKSEVEQKIRRIAFEIYEDNFKEKNIVLAGIDGQGYTFAKLISEELESISPIVVKIVKVT
ncbi:MAG: phosphoribosyltransferase family protein, partial [Cyclobacteriaceae bacterium]